LKVQSPKGRTGEWEKGECENGRMGEGENDKS